MVHPFFASEPDAFFLAVSTDVDLKARNCAEDGDRQTTGAARRVDRLVKAAEAHALLVEGGEQIVKKLIPRLDRVNPTRLRIARALPCDLQMASLVMALRNVEMARDVAEAVRLLVGAGVDRKAIRESLTAVSDAGDLGDAAARWASRTVLPSHPVPANDLYRPVQQAGDLRKLALKFRNCLRNYLVDVLDARSAFALISNGNVEAVVHLMFEDEKWVLEGLHGPRNMRPDADLKKAAIAHLSAHGVLPRHRRPYHDGPWACLRRLGGGRFDDW